jgi:hypothetical protein
LYATRVAINLYWATGLWRLVPYVTRPTSASAPVKINLLSASHNNYYIGSLTIYVQTIQLVINEEWIK